MFAFLQGPYEYFGKNSKIENKLFFFFNFQDPHVRIKLNRIKRKGLKFNCLVKK